MAAGTIPQTPEAADVIRLAQEHCIFPLIHQADIRDFGPNVYVKGEGIRLTDVNGKTVLDMMSSHTRANSLGYGNEEIARAVYDQLRTLHYAGTVANITEPAIRLASKLAELAPGRLSKVLFVSGGSEAVEAAIKLAKQYHIATGRKPRAHKVISRWFAYHGATMGALSATDWLGTRHIAEPGVPGYSFIPGPSCYRNPFGMARRGIRRLLRHVPWSGRSSMRDQNWLPPSLPSRSCRPTVSRFHRSDILSGCARFAPSMTCSGSTMKSSLVSGARAPGLPSSITGWNPTS
ncbi:MAG: hypothetical protein KatS3mg059_1685 [Thermomicrobiales bacterium]|nr:MAG: hypothetical protein KatS3mg059_1685 [Thermomicrobiales bacterium]